MAAKAPLLGSRSGKLQQFGERCGPGLMQGRTHQHLDRFQVQTAGLAAARKDDAQKPIYFARNFLADRFGRFFSCSVCGSGSAIRERQSSVLV